MQKTLLCALALALSTTLAIAAEPNAPSKDSAMGGTTSMEAMTPKSGDGAMSSDHKMSDDKMGTSDSMKPDDKAMSGDSMMKSDDNVSK